MVPRRELLKLGISTAVACSFPLSLAAASTLSPPQQGLLERYRLRLLEQAADMGLPAYPILEDQCTIAELLPATDGQLRYRTHSGWHIQLSEMKSELIIRIYGPTNQ